MWQETAIILIGILTVGYAGWKVWRLFRPVKKHTGCAGCMTVCPLKECRSASANDACRVNAAEVPRQSVDTA
ncbi:MAG: hypothetical protein LBD27_06395 [Tannerella sp.]|jgi:hypothetical protein|nr:hypothetical protein [Tannerella sp.]